jgi:tripartite-type tricarboxylate transporter receptor subunit TctC
MRCELNMADVGAGDRMQSKVTRRKFTRALAAGAAVAASLRASRVFAGGAAAEFYRGKTVRILVGSPPGGGYDIYARLVAPALAQKLGAEVLVENKAGNGGLAALATLLTRPADGLTIMNGSAEAAILSQMLGRSGVTWDVTRLNWLAKLASAPKLWFVGKTARYASVGAAREAPRLTWSATGPADDISDVQAIISYVLALHSKIVVGYRGSGDMYLAVASNEVDCSLLSADSALPHIGSIKPLALFGAKRWRHLPDVPTLREVAPLAADKIWIVDLREQIGDAQRAMVAAPDVPADRVDYLRAAFTAVLTDPAVIEEGARTNREIEYMAGGDLQKLVADLMQAAGPRLPEFKKVVLKSYF